MDSDIAIKVDHVSKTFRIPHEKVSSLRGAAVSAFKKKSYEEFKALDDVSFEVKKGEFFGIIGRNGSGKSTLLKILAGIYQADTPVKSSRQKGEFHGVKINGRISPFLELGIGFNPELSGRDNVYLNATVLGLTKKEIDEKFDSIVKFSELERFIDQKLKNYSSGMQVRLAFSVSIHANREILLMDEVLAVGDSNFQSKCLEEFNKYRDMGKTVILVSHDIATVQRYCDRTMFLRNGKILIIGKAKEVGNEYMEQNMTDEDLRFKKEKEYLEAEEKKKISKASKEEKIKIETERMKKEERERSKTARIIEAKFFNKHGEEKNIFKTGEDLNICLEIEINETIDNPIFGLVISDAFKQYPVYVSNTEFKKVVTGICEPGRKKVTFIIKNFLASGKYNVSPAVATKNQKILDWKDNFKSFNVINKEFKSGAIADFETNILI